MAEKYIMKVIVRCSKLGFGDELLEKYHNVNSNDLADAIADIEAYYAGLTDGVYTVISTNIGGEVTI